MGEQDGHVTFAVAIVGVEPNCVRFTPLLSFASLFRSFYFSSSEAGSTSGYIAAYISFSCYLVYISLVAGGSSMNSRRNLGGGRRGWKAGGEFIFQFLRRAISRSMASNLAGLSITHACLSSSVGSWVTPNGSERYVTAIATKINAAVPYLII